MQTTKVSFKQNELICIFKMTAIANLLCGLWSTYRWEYAFIVDYYEGRIEPSTFTTQIPGPTCKRQSAICNWDVK